jgi:hypothetical protein
VQAIVAYRKSRGIAPLLLVSNLNRGEQSTSRHQRVYPRKIILIIIEGGLNGPQSRSGGFEESASLSSFEVRHLRCVSEATKLYSRHLKPKRNYIYIYIYIYISDDGNS